VEVGVVGQHTMTIRNLTANIVALSALLAAGCSKAPSQAANSSQMAISQTTTSTASSAKPPEKDEIIPAGSVNLMGIDLSQFLGIYAALAKTQVDTSQLGVPMPPVLIHFKNTNAVTRSEMVQLFDSVLYDQAGIVAVHPDKNHVVLQHRSSTSNR
jgi:hypothetical protein